MTQAQRAEVLAQTHASIAENATAWAEGAIAAKGTPKALGGEEWASGPYCAMGNFGLAAKVMADLAAGKSPLEGVKFGTAPGGRVTLKVLPANTQEAMLLTGMKGEIWMPPGVTEEQVRQEAGLGARSTGEGGGVGVVLGAGNISAIGPLDVLYELVAYNRASVLKLNPTFGSLLDVYNRALKPLVDAGVLRVVNGAGTIGGYLTSHPDIDHVHITGSAITHDAIVWGVGAEADERRAKGDPKLTKAITSELGGVSPIIVVPGNWSKSDLKYQAEHVLTQRLHNCGHNCIAGQTLILSKDWPQKDAFLDAIRDAMAKLPPRPAWYPGSDRKLGLAETSYPAAEHLGGRLLIEVDESTSQDLFTTEYFGPVLGHTELPGTGIDFLTKAVRFANERLDGTLGASLIVKGRDRKAMGRAFDEAIADLRYGSIGINAWSAVAFLMPAMPWGAFPGHTLEEVGSGIGTVHNNHLVAGPERSVITAPFRSFPIPPWFVTAKNGLPANIKLAEYAKAPSWGSLMKVVVAAIKG
jgi:hypothetical protein